MLFPMLPHCRFKCTSLVIMATPCQSLQTLAVSMPLFWTSHWLPSPPHRLSWPFLTSIQAWTWEVCFYCCNIFRCTHFEIGPVLECSTPELPTPDITFQKHVVDSFILIGELVFSFVARGRVLLPGNPPQSLNHGLQVCVIWTHFVLLLEKAATALVGNPPSLDAPLAMPLVCVVEDTSKYLNSDWKRVLELWKEVFTWPFRITNTCSFLSTHTFTNLWASLCYKMSRKEIQKRNLWHKMVGLVSVRGLLVEIWIVWGN